MFTCHQLNKYEYKIYENKNQTLLMLSGYEGYYQILTEAFQTLGFSVRFEDRFRPNYWDTYVNTVNEDTLQKIHCLLKIFKNHVFIEDALDQTFALDHHSQVGGGRSEIGELVYNSKPYKNPFTPT
ncbi:MAG: hypothetical protein MUF87_19795, partial [Anaerolineae bacterium]|nr:hypothetical protein [Anaerolineae bacterium]